MPNILSIICGGGVVMPNNNYSFQNVIEFIEQADDLEIEQIMKAVQRRYVVAFPQWEVLYLAVHKDPVLRKKDMEALTAYIAKDLKWNEEQQKKDSLV